MNQKTTTSDFGVKFLSNPSWWAYARWITHKSSTRCSEYVSPRETTTDLQTCKYCRRPCKLSSIQCGCRAMSEWCQKSRFWHWRFPSSSCQFPMSSPEWLVGANNTRNHIHFRGTSPNRPAPRTKFLRSGTMRAGYCRTTETCDPDTSLFDERDSAGKQMNVANHTEEETRTSEEDRNKCSRSCNGVDCPNKASVPMSSSTERKKTKTDVRPSNPQKWNAGHVRPFRKKTHREGQQSASRSYVTSQETVLVSPTCVYVQRVDWLVVLSQHVVTSLHWERSWNKQRKSSQRTCVGFQSSCHTLTLTSILGQRAKQI